MSEELKAGDDSSSARHASLESTSAVIPVIEEQLTVEKVARESGSVTVHVAPAVRREQVEVAVSDIEVEVVRVEVGKIVEATSPPRQEGDMTIIPIYDEVVVMEKKLRLREEIHLIRKHRPRVERHEVELQKDEVKIDRRPPP